MKRATTVAALVTILLALAAAVGADLPKLSADQWAKLKADGAVTRSWSDGGTQNAGWGVTVFNVSPEMMWKALCAFELYDDYIKTKTVSRLVDEETRARIIKGNFESGDEVERLFKGMKPNYRRTLPDGRYVVYSYQRDSMPWPVSDRWLLLEITVDDKDMKQTWKRLAGNVKNDFGLWHIYSWENGKSLGELELHLDGGIPAPSSFINYGMSIIVPQTMRDFEDIGKAMSRQNPAR
jgi:hypothetical protein